MTEKMCFSISKCQDIRCAHIALFQCAISRFQSSIDSKIFINPKRERIILIDFYIGTRFSRKRSYISILNGSCGRPVSGNRIMEIAENENRGDCQDRKN